MIVDNSFEKENLNNFFECDRDKLFPVLLDLLKEFNDLCQQHNLKYYAQGGTMLGAVRHHGFIPWDDDVDLAMMRDDFDKLLELIPKIQLPEPYRFLTPLTDMEYSKGLIRLCNVSTTAVTVHDAGLNYTKGIFIDIFPLDAIPDKDDDLKKYGKKLNFAHTVMSLVSRCAGTNGSAGLSSKQKKLYTVIQPLVKMGILNKETAFKRFSKAASFYQNKNQQRICLSTYLIREKFMNLKSDYDVEIIDMPFENTTIPVPVTYDRILKNHYGPNYMTPVHEKTNHGDTLFSTSMPYVEFVNIYRKELEAMWLEHRNKVVNG